MKGMPRSVAIGVDAIKRYLNRVVEASLFSTQRPFNRSAITVHFYRCVYPEAGVPHNCFDASNSLLLEEDVGPGLEEGIYSNTEWLGFSAETADQGTGSTTNAATMVGGDIDAVVENLESEEGNTLGHPSHGLEDDAETEAAIEEAINVPLNDPVLMGLLANTGTVNMNTRSGVDEVRQQGDGAIAQRSRTRSDTLRYNSHGSSSSSTSSSSISMPPMRQRRRLLPPMDSDHDSLSSIDSEASVQERSENLETNNGGEPTMSNSGEPTMSDRGESTTTDGMEELRREGTQHGGTDNGGGEHSPGIGDDPDTSDPNTSGPKTSDRAEPVVYVSTRLQMGFYRLTSSSQVSIPQILDPSSPFYPGTVVGNCPICTYDIIAGTDDYVVGSDCNTPHPMHIQCFSEKLIRDSEVTLPVFSHTTREEDVRQRYALDDLKELNKCPICSKCQSWRRPGDDEELPMGRRRSVTRMRNIWLWST